jgi:hypothetical protein
MLKRRVLLSLGLLFLQSSSLLAGESEVFDERYKRLESISTESPKFISALVELQKIHYQKGIWDKFFAYAVFYRNRSLDSEEKWKSNFNSQLISLEVLGLAKHCHWQAGYQIAQQGIMIAKKVAPPQSIEIENALVFYPALKSFEEIRGKQQTKEVPDSLFREMNYWKIKNDAIRWVPHPRVLKFSIENRCQS